MDYLFLYYGRTFFHSRFSVIFLHGNVIKNMKSQRNATQDNTRPSKWNLISLLLSTILCCHIFFQDQMVNAVDDNDDDVDNDENVIFIYQNKYGTHCLIEMLMLSLKYFEYHYWLLLFAAYIFFIPMFDWHIGRLCSEWMDETFLENRKNVGCIQKANRI